MVEQPFFQSPPQGGHRGVVTRSSNLLNDTQYQVLPSQNPGVELTMLSGDPLHCVFPVALPEGGEDSECVNPTGERKDSVCTVPTGRGKDSMCTVPTGGGKTLCVQSPPDGEKTLCVQSQDISNLVQFKNVYIQKKVKDLPVGGRLRQFLLEWENMGPTS